MRKSTSRRALEDQLLELQKDPRYLQRRDGKLRAAKVPKRAKTLAEAIQNPGLQRPLDRQKYRRRFFDPEDLRGCSKEDKKRAEHQELMMQAKPAPLPHETAWKLRDFSGWRCSTEKWQALETEAKRRFPRWPNVKFLVMWVDPDREERTTTCYNFNHLYAYVRDKGSGTNHVKNRSDILEWVLDPVNQPYYTKDMEHKKMHYVAIGVKPGEERL